VKVAVVTEAFGSQARAAEFLHTALEFAPVLAKEYS